MELISFPEREHKDIKKVLRTKGYSSTVRSCYELNKYKANQLYRTPWDEIIKITKVTRYRKAEDIPTWNKMDKGMKISCRMAERYGNSQWDFIEFKRKL